MAAGEDAVVRLMITEELKRVMTEKFAAEGKRLVAGLKEELYAQFGVEPPKPLSPLEKKLARLARLQAQVEALERESGDQVGQPGPSGRSARSK